MQEVKTAAYVTKTLQDLGIEVQTGIGGTTGVMGIIKGSEPGPVVMLRADMDALPILQLTAKNVPSMPAVMTLTRLCCWLLPAA